MVAWAFWRSFGSEITPYRLPVQSSGPGNSADAHALLGQRMDQITALYCFLPGSLTGLLPMGPWRRDRPGLTVGLRNTGQKSAIAPEYLLDHFREVLQQMEPISYLRRLGCSPLGAITILTASIPADGPDTGLSLQPFSEAF